MHGTQRAVQREVPANLTEGRFDHCGGLARTQCLGMEPYRAGVSYTLRDLRCIGGDYWA